MGIKNNFKFFFYISLGSSNLNRLGPGLVNMNGRIFAFGAYDTTDPQVVEEYLPAKNLW